MAHSLLAHLYTHIKGSQEDIATLALQYLLMQSTALNKVFTNRISNILNIKTEDTLQYSTQVTGEDNERPDMAGTDSDGKEQILCEMKFYAGLTANQPLGYLKRLEENGGKGLIFVCPKSRKEVLWYELKKICKDAQRCIEEVDEFCVSIDGINMAITTWIEIIGLLMNTAEASAEHLIADIKQLKGYCEQIDSEAFIPFTPEDLSADIAKKADRYYWIIDKVIEMLRADSNLNVSLSGIKATAYRNGYTRSAYINDYTITLNYDRTLWRNSDTVDTPFWFSVRNHNWQQTDEICKELKKTVESRKSRFWNQYFVALDVKVFATEDEVCKDLKKQILNYINEIDKGIHSNEITPCLP